MHYVHGEFATVPSCVHFWNILRLCIWSDTEKRSFGLASAAATFNTRLQAARNDTMIMLLGGMAGQVVDIFGSLRICCTGHKRTADCECAKCDVFAPPS